VDSPNLTWRIHVTLTNSRFFHNFYRFTIFTNTKSGQNNQSGKSILKSDYTEENDVEKNLKLAVKILLKVNTASYAIKS
jgi:hypothetical protein